jgi:hypothetical protein
MIEAGKAETILLTGAGAMTDRKDSDEGPGGEPLDEAEERRVRERAYEIWDEEGRPEGRALDHWLRAARERLADQNLRLAEGEISSLCESD